MWYAVRLTVKSMHAPYILFCTSFCISPEPIFSNQLNVFNFCAVRLMLAGVISSLWFCLFVDRSMLVVCLFVLVAPRFYPSYSHCVSSCLLIATDLCTLWFFQMSDEEEIDAKVFCKWVACVFITCGITFFPVVFFISKSNASFSLMPCNFSACISSFDSCLSSGACCSMFYYISVCVMCVWYE